MLESNTLDDDADNENVVASLSDDDADNDE